MEWHRRRRAALAPEERRAAWRIVREAEIERERGERRAERKVREADERERERKEKEIT